MEQKKYLELIERYNSIKIDSFDKMTSDIFMKIFLKLGFGIILMMLFLLIVGVVALFTNYDVKVLLNIINLTLYLVLPCSLFLSFISFRYRTGNILFFHSKLIKKIAFKKLLKSIDNKEEEVILKIKNHLDSLKFGVDTSGEKNKVNINELLVDEIIDEVRFNNILKVVDIKDIREDMAGKDFEYIWNKKCHIYPEKYHIYQVIGMYKTYIISILPEILTIENKLVNILSESNVKNITKDILDEDVNKIVRELYLQETLEQKDNIIVRKKKI